MFFLLLDSKSKEKAYLSHRNPTPSAQSLDHTQVMAELAKQDVRRLSRVFLC